MKYEVFVSVEKVISVKVKANSDEEAIEKAKNKLMTSSEDFAQILDACVE
ncbi:hypothetical protein [Bacillus sp. S3]|nr:hypothetical protein [Bacillus sp. S3]